MGATEWIVISKSNLVDPHPSGGWIRAYCPIHGGDHQRSLSVNEETGFGRCHQCGAQVLLEEFNFEAAERIGRGQARIASGEIRILDPKYIARAASAPKKPRTIETWQQEELACLRHLHQNMMARLSDDRASTYIAGRGISLSTANAAGVGYIPDVPLKGKYACLARWADHLIFPVGTPTDGQHFASRSLRLWRPGMDENEHKALLKEKKLEKHLKTYIGGWFN
jgi:DNA primase